MKRLPDEKSHGLGARREQRKNKKWPIIYFFSDDFGLRSVLSHSETVSSDEKCYLHRSTRQKLRV